MNRLILYTIVALISLSSCRTVHKLHDKQKINTDSTAKVSTNSTTVSIETNKLDTSFYTEADTLDGYADVADVGDTAVIESDDQIITVTKPINKKGVHVQSVAKPKQVNVKVDNTKAVFASTNENSNVTLHKDVKVKSSDKTAKTPWYVFVIQGCVLLCILWLIIYLVRKYFFKDRR